MGLARYAFADPRVIISLVGVAVGAASSSFRAEAESAGALYKFWLLGSSERRKMTVEAVKPSSWQSADPSLIPIFEPPMATAVAGWLCLAATKAQVPIYKGLF